MTMRRLSAVVLAAILMPAWGAFGADISYTVDPTRSFLNFVPSTTGATVGSNGEFILTPTPSGVPQISSDGVPTSYSGTVVINRSKGATSFQFAGGEIVALPSGEWGFPSGTASPSSYRVFESTFIGAPLLYTVDRRISGAVRDFSFSLSSPTITSNTFNASQLSAEISSGQFDSHLYQSVSAIVGPPTEMDNSSPFGGSLSFASASATLDDAAGTMTIPMDTMITVPTLYGPETFEVKGQIFAILAMPEPGTVLMLGVAGVMLTRRRGMRRSAPGGGVASMRWNMTG